ncbi:MAG: hypothetical protein CHKLHMKO_00648 [Candidatus Argoarchaeum ethanivorans]|uniref:Uncharacterized protein n=1 Tax=Candidatus Argoarchaeum ethanivorans TaxID=2608793 RepID=A0A811TA51_9EURY|nr:MAG: hypothetical protein CHKLHMKO_00648 [Candidatus Argoarchaeum ethanivorans]
MKCPICDGELKKVVEKSVVKGFEVPTEFYRCESCEEELMTDDQFGRGMDKIIELKANVLVSSVEGDHIKLPKELVKRLRGKYVELIPEDDRIVVIPK